MPRSLDGSRVWLSLVGLLLLVGCTQTRRLANVGDKCTSNSDCASVNCVAGTCQAPDVTGQVDKSLVADVRPKQLVAATGQQIQLYGGWSTVLASKKLSYSWTLSAPEGSTATLSDPSAESPTFTADRAGKYVAMLTVRDGERQSEVSSMEVTIYDPETDDVHLVAPLFPPLTVGDLRLFQTPYDTIELRVENSQELGGVTHFRLVPLQFGAGDYNPLSVIGVDPPMLIVDSPTAGRKMRAMEFNDATFLAEPPLIIVPHALKLGVPTTHWAKTKLVDNGQEVYLQFQATVTLVAIEPCSLQSGASYDQCYKIQREIELVAPLASRSSQPRTRIRMVQWLVDGIGVVKIQREVAEAPQPRDTPLPPGETPTRTYDPAAPVAWEARDLPSELTYYRIGDLEFGSFPPLSLTLGELSAELAPKIDGSRDDWANIAPLVVDLPDQAGTIPGSDLKGVSLALDSEWLSVLLTFHNGAPKPDFGYSFEIQAVLADPTSRPGTVRIGGPDPSPLQQLSIAAGYVGGVWKCTVGTLPGEALSVGEIAGGDDFVELRVPRGGLIQQLFEQGVKLRIYHYSLVGQNLEATDSIQLPSVIAIPAVGR